jgi:type IV secretory pathway VirB10-like protein
MGRRRIVNMKIAAVFFGLALFSNTGAVQAQDSDESDEMEATMRLMGDAEAELPDAVTRLIELPDAVLDKHPESPAVGASADGMMKANENPRRQEDGFEQANDARENAADMAEQAQDNQESRGRSQDRPDPPGPPGG